MALVLGYYNKNNLGDEQYQISIPPLLHKSGFRGEIRFENPHDLDAIPQNTQIIICGGGDIINDWFLKKTGDLIKQFRGPVIALSVGVTYASTVCKKYLIYDYIVLRHLPYLDEVSRVIGSSRVQSIPDLGFSLNPVRALVFNRPRIGLFIANGADGCDLIAIRDVMRIYTKKYDVVAYSMNCSDEFHEGDHYANADLGFNEAPKCNVTELMAHIGGLHLAVCMRYHSHVFSIVQGTAFVSLALTPKTKFLMSDHKFVHNVAMSIDDLSCCIDYSLSNRTTLIAQVRQVRTDCACVLANFMVPGITRSTTTLAEDCRRMLVGKIPSDAVARHALIHVVGSSINKYTYGFIENIKNSSHNILDMIKWVVNDARPAPVTGLRFLQSISTFSGIHRSGWEAAAKMLKSLETPDGILCDLYVDATFHWNQADLLTKCILPFKQKWIGFIHHTPLEDYTPYNTVALFNNPVFLQSLRFCKALIVLSTTLADWVRGRLAQLNFTTQVLVIMHPTELTHKTFNLRTWLDTPVVTQIGAWLRDPYAIYALRLPWGRKQTLEGPKMESYIHPRKWYLANTTTCKCGTRDVIERGANCMSRISRHADGETVMTEYMTRYVHTHPNIPEFVEVRAGDPCCSESQIWSDKWMPRITAIHADLLNNYNSVSRLSNLTNAEYDDLMTRTVVFVNLLDCSAANTIVECLVRNTPIVVNTHPAVQEYLGVNYPGFYTKGLDTVWRVFNPSKIYQTHEYLVKLDKTRFMLDQFLKKFETLLTNII